MTALVADQRVSPSKKKGRNVDKMTLRPLIGSGGRSRTYDQPVNSRLLYH